MADPLPVVVPSIADPNALMLEKEVAAYARVSLRTVQRWAASDRGPRRVWLGGTVRYRVGDVLAWVAAGAKDSEAA